MISVSDLRCEYLAGPVVLDDPNPRFSWRLDASEPGQAQTAYEVVVMEESKKWGDTPQWTSGRVESSATTQIVYQGTTEPHQRLLWRVRVWDSSHNVSPWSEPASWQVGFRRNDNWTACWISGVHKWKVTPPTGRTYFKPMFMSPTMHLRRPFEIEGEVRRAAVYATARGVYRLSINGQRVGDHELSPGWTDYNTRQQYQAYDVTTHLRQGANVLGALLGEGWYAGYLGYNLKHAGGHYGDVAQLLAELHIEYKDGSVVRVCSDGLWKCSRGPRLWSDILQGEFYDSTQEIPGWDSPDFDDSSWAPVSMVPELGTAQLIAEPAPPIRVSRRLAPARLWKSAEATWIVDFGEYVSGVTEITLEGERGSLVTLRHGEWLAEGAVYTDNLHSASSMDRVILRGGRQTFRPLFTQHGFQYVEVQNYPGELNPENIYAVQFHTDMRKTGSFECSDPRLTKLALNADRTVLSNAMSVPTCEPSRDERMAYLGDTHIAAATAMFSRDHSSFYSKWTDDILDAAQANGGLFTDAAPTPFPSEGAPGWGDGGIILPWSMYRFYGDTRIIDKMWPSMTSWMSAIHEANPDLIRRNRLNNNYNDWLVPGNEDLTPPPVLATAYWAWCAQLMAEMASASDRTQERDQYRDLASSIAVSYANNFLSHDGRIEGDTQTVYAMAFRMGLVPPEARAAVADRFRESFEREAYKVRVGFAGVSFLLSALHEAGLTELAYKLLLDDRYPSWLYSLTHGATSVWERWNTVTEDGSFPTVNMNSFSLLALGSAVEWLYRGVAGINSVEGDGGMGRVLIAPIPGPGLTWAKATHETLHGQIVSEWHLDGPSVRYMVEIPTNVTATIEIMTTDPRSVEQIDECDSWSVAGNSAAVNVGAGRFEFSAPLPQALETTPATA
jgi:alpha-L-rhamnosidase